VEGLDEGAKCTRFNSLAQFRHQVMVVVQIVLGHQQSAQHFTALVQVMQVAARKLPAGVM
jgi:hypothetical protein